MRAYRFSGGALELYTEFYTRTMLTSEWRARWSTKCWTWTKISSNFSLLSHCYRPVTNLCLGVYASPSSVPRVNPHCAPSSLTRRCSIYLLWFVFACDAADQTQNQVHPQQVLCHWAPSPTWFYFVLLFILLLCHLVWSETHNSPASASQVPGLQPCTIVLTMYTAKLEFQFSCLGCKKHRKGLEGKVFVQFSRAEPALRDKVMISPCSGTLENAVSASISGTNSMARTDQMVSDHMKANQKMSVHSSKC